MRSALVMSRRVVCGITTTGRLRHECSATPGLHHHVAQQTEQSPQGSGLQFPVAPVAPGGQVYSFQSERPAERLGNGLSRLETVDLTPALDLSATDHPDWKL